MTTIPYDQPRHRHLAGWLSFIRHYIEMVLAMVIGMYALMPLWPVAFRAAGAPHLLDHAEPMALSMATGMAIGMGAWMAFRRHGWRDIAEMTAAMYLPFVILFPATLAGAMTSGLSVLEQRVGTGPDVRDVDREIAQVRRDKEAAIDAQDFENAAVLRDRERQLLSDKAAREQEWAICRP